MHDIVLRINDKNYRFKFTINTLCDMKSDGINVMEIEDTFDFSILRALFFYGLQKFHSEQIKKLNDAGDLMDDYFEQGGNINELGDIMSKGLTKSLGIKAVAEGK